MADQKAAPEEGTGHAARQMALVFVMGVALTLAGLLIAPPGDRGAVIVIAAALLALAAGTWLFPWERFDPRLPLVLCLPVLGILGYCTLAFEGSSVGTAPFFMLLFVWVGLHFPTTAVLAMGPLTALAYVVPLAVDDRGAVVVIGATLFVPTAMAVGALISRQVNRQHRARETIQRMERWRAALTATLAHDVRSPLTSVQFALETLDEDGDVLPPEQRHAIIASALRQTNRIRRLATSLLDAERIDSRGLHLDLRPIRLHAAVEDAVSYLTAPVGMAVDPDLTVRADPQRLEQILVNLTANAIRHGAPPIIVSAEPTTGGMVAVHVRDHGPGVPEEKREALFSRFSSADTSPESVGLGLWITRELVRAHGGDVQHSPADPGTRFTFTIPAA
ncbi:sensor histidine kinase [Planobispora takensis]|uniref:histidine kinase n=1 Tax=Planobispora takensis TaxID=1367882 RepID=A0A8J3T282_9ACTN|nr:HAMP domain-containing sensor histidine kinase [Planobispora takensis]GIH99733.1 hypothetical protein Pta02_17420 [Planobispora takensis]